MKTYKLLRELMFYLAEAETDMIFKFLLEMDDVEFKEVPTLLFTDETIKMLNTYATVFLINRKDGSEKGFTEHKIYFIGASIFRVTS